MKSHLSIAIVGFVLVGVLGLHLPDADARGRIRFNGVGLARGMHHSGPTLSREQLRVCIGQQNRLNAGGENLDKTESALQSKASEIKTLEANIKRKEALVDQYSQASVDSFNALIGRYKMVVATYNSGLPAYNAEVNKYKAEVQAFNTKCAGHAYYESDMQAVIAGK